MVRQIVMLEVVYDATERPPSDWPWDQMLDMGQDETARVIGFDKVTKHEECGL